MRTADFKSSLAVIFCIALSGCSLNPSPAGTPTPSNAFTGQLLLSDENGADYRLSVNPSTGNAEIDRLYEGSFGSISPDHSFIIYLDSDGMEMRLYDLTTGEDRPIAQGEVECVGWSPESTMFNAVVDGVLYVYDLAGTARMVYEAPSAEYELRGQVHSELGCGSWIAPDRLVFQRYKGLMPGSITVGSGSPVAANTTTLGVIGNEIELVDSPKRWFVMDVCMKGSLVLLDEWGGALSELNWPYPQIFPVKLFLAEGFQDFEDLVPRALGIDLAWDIGFIPGSADCELYAVCPHASESILPLDILYVDPITLERRFVFTLEDEDQSRDAAVLWHGVWIGDPNDGTIAVEEILPQADERTISMINLSSGERSVLADSHTQGWTGDLGTWAWLP